MSARKAMHMPPLSAVFFAQVSLPLTLSCGRTSGSSIAPSWLNSATSHFAAGQSLPSGSEHLFAKTDSRSPSCYAGLVRYSIGGDGVERRVTERKFGRPIARFLAEGTLRGGWRWLISSGFAM